MRDKNGQFGKGNKGRPKGSKNKKTLAKKEQLEALFHENGGFDTLFASIQAIDDPKDKANAMMKVMEFFMSKEKSIEVTGDSLFGSIEIIEDDGTESEAKSTD